MCIFTFNYCHVFIIFFLQELCYQDIFLLKLSRSMTFFLCDKNDAEYFNFKKLNFCRYFWDVVLNLPKETQKRLLLFTTGSDRIPIGGIKEMMFKISRIDDLKL